MKFTRYHTRSGSQYDVAEDGQGDYLVRQSKAGGAYRDGRLAGGQWRGAVEAHLSRAPGDECLVVFWGTGRDEFSPNDGLPDEPRSRFTTTSMVIRTEELEEPDGDAAGK